MAISRVDAEASRLQVRGYALQQQKIENRAENASLNDRIYEDRRVEDTHRFGGASIDYSDRQRLLDITV